MRLLAAVLSIALSTGLGARCLASDEDDFRAAIKGWTSPNSGAYKADPYIGAARMLQRMGKDDSVRLLSTCADERDLPGVPVTSLCRLVFKAKKDSTFRRVGTGAVGFLGGTKYEDWPLDPFEVVGGVPFAVTDGSWMIGGVAESDRKYLGYCVKECEWNDLKFKPKTAKEKEAALEVLLASKKWKTPLAEDERDRLRAQIK
jgi:hypothetical protein